MRRMLVFMYGAVKKKFNRKFYAGHVASFDEKDLDYPFLVRETFLLRGSTVSNSLSFEIKRALLLVRRARQNSDVKVDWYDKFPAVLFSEGFRTCAYLLPARLRMPSLRSSTRMATKRT